MLKSKTFTPFFGRHLSGSGMKNVEEGNSDNISTAPKHSNLNKLTKCKTERCNESLNIKKDSISQNIETNSKERLNPNIKSEKAASISHPKVIDILDNQLEQL